ncbi:MAG: restriction endonuclease subunit S [Bacillota bacterium]
MRTMTVPRNWMDLNGRRLDSRPYFSGATEAKVILEKLPVAKDDLYKLTENEDGIFNGPRFARQYVDDPDFGVPFLGSTDILLADLSLVPFLSKKYIQKHPELLIKEGWTLITCSGTIGRMAFARREMHGAAGSQHFMRVVPDEGKIKPGYLYSFLSSKYGLPMIIGMTYGAIIQHIEPHHIKDLPVPRLGEIEIECHNLCSKAAEMRTLANEKLHEASSIINNALGFPSKISIKTRNFSITKACSKETSSRLEATFHDWVARQSDALLDNVPSTSDFHTVASFGETGRMTQVFVSKEYGVPFITSKELFLLRLDPDRFLSRKLLPEDESWKVEEGNILIARSGQVGGIIGHCVWADKRFENVCVSVDVIRLKAKNILPGYLFAYLNLTDIGYRQMVRTAAGSSIPHLFAEYLKYLRIPRTDEGTEKIINELVFEAGKLRAEAQTCEDNARKIVEYAIEEMSHG